MRGPRGEGIVLNPKKMGKIIKSERKSGIEKGLEDIRKGNVYRAKDSKDLLKQILG